MQFFTNTSIDFMGKRRIGFVISGILILAGLVSLVIRGGPNFGVDFRGGIVIQATFDRSISAKEIRSALQAEGVTRISVQHGETDHEVVISTPDVEMPGENDLSELIKNTLTGLLFSIDSTHQSDLNNGIIPEELRQGFEEFKRHDIVLSDNAVVSDEGQGSTWLITDSDKQYIARSQEDKLNIYLIRGDNAWKVDEKGINIDKVSPSVGRDLMGSSIKSIVFALILILAYIWIRFELRFGVAAIITLVHDVIITLGIFSLLNEEINLPTIAAFLTIVGYSLNDTIVVFDRIRENIKTQRGKEFDSIINSSINQTISRTIITSTTTLFAVLSIFFISKVGTLHTLSLALMIGIIVGTYSSIFVASPILHGWHLRVQRDKR